LASSNAARRRSKNSRRYSRDRTRTGRKKRIVLGKEPEKLPPVLNREEIVRFLEAVEGLRNRVGIDLDRALSGREAASSRGWRRRLLTSSKLHADHTPVQVLALGTLRLRSCVTAVEASKLEL
jgi:integrase